MLRFAAFSLFAVLLCPGALAEEIASVAVGPDGLVDDPAKDPYYLWATLSTPTRPTDQGPDCGANGKPRPNLPEAALGIAEPIAAWDPLAQPSASSWFPGCVATQTPFPCGMTPIGCPASAKGYVAYDVATGDYYVALTLVPGAGGMPGLSLVPPPFAYGSEIVVAGNSGLAMQADCEYCPPPP